MTSHLLAISIGPVQGFIAAARRTRDLWMGSYLLSEISKAVALNVHQGHNGTRCQPVFPAPDNPGKDLAPGSPLIVANIIIAIVPAEVDARMLAESAKQAAQTRWEGFARNARRGADAALKSLGLAGVRGDIWDVQIKDVIEFYAAWTPMDGDNDYKNARRQAMRLLAGRKNLRDFQLGTDPDKQLPKSSLDGLRETVLPEPKRDTDKKPLPMGSAKLRVANGEQLDVIGVTKRAYQPEAEEQLAYPSVSRIAADPWLRRAVDRAQDDKEGFAALWDAFKNACQGLHKQGALVWLDTKRFPQFEKFPYEGSVIYEERHKDLIDEAGLTEDGLKDVKTALRALIKGAEVNRKNVRGLGEPSPYVAVLIADGDKMGEAISNLGTSDENRRFSKDLSGFAGKVEHIVEENSGISVYVGGDDVLAFVPVDKSLSCAGDLHREFADILKVYHGPPTLSVGVAIGHCLEALEDLLEFGRDAEKDAKEPDRNGLAVHFRPRGNEVVKVRRRWNDTKKIDLVKQFEDWMKLFQTGALPSKVAFDLRKLAETYRNWPVERDSDKNLLREAMKADIKLLLNRKWAGKAVPMLQSRILEMERELPADQIGHGWLKQMADELVIARRLAGLSPQDEAVEGQSGDAEEDSE